jgi:hypothetical protein
VTGQAAQKAPVPLVFRVVFMLEIAPELSLGIGTLLRREEGRATSWFKSCQQELTSTGYPSGSMIASYQPSTWTSSLVVVTLVAFILTGLLNKCTVPLNTRQSFEFPNA